MFELLLRGLLFLGEAALELIFSYLFYSAGWLALRLPLVHADFYRLKDPQEAEELGLDDYRHGAAMLAEWPEMAGGFTHEPGCLAIRLETAETGRIAIVEPGADWLGRMP